MESQGTHGAPGPWHDDEGLRRRWRCATDEVVAALLSGEDADHFLEVVAGAAMRLVAADLADIAVPFVPGQSLRLRVTVGHRAHDLRHAIFPLEESLSGRVLRTRRGMVVADALTCDAAYQPVCELGDMGPVLLVPLVVQGEAFGTLLVARRHGGAAFTTEDLEALGSFADHAALAFQFERAHEELARLAVVEEREQIERDLHDTVIQHLFAIGLDLQGVAATCAPDTAARIEGAVTRINDIMTEVRSTVLERSWNAPLATSPTP